MRTYTPQTSKKLIYQDNVALEYCNVVRKKKPGLTVKKQKTKCEFTAIVMNFKIDL